MDQIKEIVNKVIQTISVKPQEDKDKIQKAWQSLIDPKEAKHAKISALNKDVLYINVDSSAWLYQFNLKKQKYLEGIQREIPDIKRIHFKIGKTI